MDHFPIFLSTKGRHVVLSGGGEAALAKLRLLLKTEARIHVFAPDPAPEIIAWAQADRLILQQRPLAAGDVAGAALFYAPSPRPKVRW
jgi:uroporphyrin-III C-methyltransferase/precorrin-2 dehydrogenase/sirohydrochlorin ferrochelatase